jgi:hypothetical protein
MMLLTPLQFQASFCCWSYSKALRYLVYLDFESSLTEAPLLLLSLQPYNRGMSLDDLGRTLFIRLCTELGSTANPAARTDATASTAAIKSVQLNLT